MEHSNTLPMTMPKFTLEQKLRTGHIKRWQIVRVAREQTIAEHMYRVHVIVDEFCRAANAHPALAADAKAWALMHDMPEVVTGDIATPTKRALREAVPKDDPVRQIELSLDDDYAKIYLGLKQFNPVVLTLVKLADIAEAIDFLEVEGMGGYAHRALRDLRDTFARILAEAPAAHPFVGSMTVDWTGVGRVFDDNWGEF